jgi:hypothetical protein
VKGSYGKLKYPQRIKGLQLQVLINSVYVYFFSASGKNIHNSGLKENVKCKMKSGGKEHMARKRTVHTGPLNAVRKNKK